MHIYPLSRLIEIERAYVPHLHQKELYAQEKDYQTQTYANYIGIKKINSKNIKKITSLEGMVSVK